MKQNRLLPKITIVVVLLYLIYWVWSGWGLITVDVEHKPLADVIRSIEKQGGIVLKTNMDPATPVTMHVFKVPLADALEDLSIVTDSRWQLTYLYGGDKGAIQGAIETITSGKKPEGWANFDVPLMGGRGAQLADVPAPMDPRTDTWNVKEPEAKTLQAYLRGASVGVAARFACPETFNPAVASAPSSGPIRKAAPQLAKTSGAQVQELFLLLGRAVGVAEADDAGGDEDGPQRPRGNRPDFTLMRERRLAEIEKLPAAEQAQAKAEMDDREKLFAGVRDLPPEERRAKMEELFSNTDMQEKMEERRMDRSEKQTPEQRLKRYQKYVTRKNTAKEKAAK